MKKQFLELAIQKSQQSFEEGNFPAGAVVVREDDVISSAVSSPYPGLFHADSKAISAAFQTYGVLTECELYVGLENCLMCLGIAYWAGIRDIYYAVPKSKVSGDYYETHEDVSLLASTFNEPIRMHHVPELEGKALKIIKQWEARIKK